MLGITFVPEGRLSSDGKRVAPMRRYLCCKYLWLWLAMQSICFKVKCILLFWESVTSISGKKLIHIYLQHGVRLDTWLIHVEEEPGDVAPERWTWILALLSNSSVTLLQPLFPQLQSKNGWRINHNSYYLLQIYITIGQVLLLSNLHKFSQWILQHQVGALTSGLGRVFQAQSHRILQMECTIDWTM